jgi:Lon protease-like protein
MGARRQHRPCVAFHAAADCHGAFGGRNSLPPAFPNFLGRLTGEHILLKARLHITRTDQHGAHIVAEQFHAQAFGEGSQGAFGCAVESHPRQRHFAGDRSHIHNHPAPPRAHVRRYQMDETERREEVQFHQSPNFIHGRIPGRPIDPHGGIVDKDIDGAVAFERAVHEQSLGLRVGEIARRAEGVAACPAQSFFGPATQREAGAGARKLSSASRPDALRGAGDDHHFAIEFHEKKVGVRTLAEPLCLLQFVLKRHNVTMPSRLIPLFPLEVVVFPRTPLPLHIFEERYKEMVGGAIRENSEFGMVLTKGEGIVNAGCTVIVEKVLHVHPDGRMDILTRGQRRFEIQSLDEEKDYLQAKVDFFDDDDFAPVPAELRDRAIGQFRSLRKISGMQGSEEPNFEDPQVSFQLAQVLPDLDFLNSLLRHRSETGRLKELNQYLADYIPRRQNIERVKAVAPKNGFGGKPAGL